MDINKTGIFIAQLRKEKGLSQKELGEKLDITDKAVSRWETGKGLPDISLLEPLSEALGVSVGELLAGKRMNPETVQKDTDRVILESLLYSRKMLKHIGSAVLIPVAALALIYMFISAVKWQFWPVGLLLICAALACSFRCGAGPKQIYIWSVVLQIGALILEAIPGSAALVFFAGPNATTRTLFSCFDACLVGYGSYIPFLVGILTILHVVFGIVILIRFERTFKWKNVVFVSTIIAAGLFPLPILLGSDYITPAGLCITALLGVSAVLQAVANRKI